jgi:hypothetical protein
MVIAGQSHGGLTTMALGTFNVPGVKGLINFAGGLRQETCTSWESNLARAFGSYGEKTTQPSIWFYGDNDSFWPIWLYQQMYKNYIANGANAKLVAFGVFGSDAHSMFGSKDGELIWQPQVSQFLASIGLPAEVSASGRQYVLADSDISRPLATPFAPLNDETKVPFIPVERRGVYKDYLTKSYPRAFAIAPNGSLGWATAGADPMRRALEFCNRRGEGLCRLYSVDDDVVWVAP